MHNTYVIQVSYECIVRTIDSQTRRQVRCLCTRIHIYVLRIVIICIAQTMELQTRRQDALQRLEKQFKDRENLSVCFWICRV